MISSMVRFLSSLVVVFVSILVFTLYLPSTNFHGKYILKALGGDHIVHVLVGSLLPLSLAITARVYRLPIKWQWTFWFTCLTVFGGDELLQGLSPLRESDPTDFMMSALGWLIGCSLWWVVWLLLRRRAGW